VGRGSGGRRGWIALALTTFANLASRARAGGRVSFRGRDDAAVSLQSEGVQIASQLLTMLPYLATSPCSVLDLAQFHVDSHQHAEFARQAVLSRLVSLAAGCRLPSST